MRSRGRSSADRAGVVDAGNLTRPNTPFRSRLSAHAQGGRIADTKKQVVIEEVTDPAEIAAARAQRERSDRNAALLEAHAKEVYTRHRGKCVCVAGAELFVADTPEEAMALAQAAHPGDDGSFMRYVRKEESQWLVRP